MMRYLPVFLCAALVALWGCDPDSVGNSDFTATPSSLAFGDVDLSTSKRLTVTVVNTSGSDQYPIPSITGSDAAAFSLVYQPSQIKDGAEDSVIVEFTPSQKRNYSAELKIGSGSPLIVSLTGRGIDASAPYDLSLASNLVQQAPTIDGSGSDAAWSGAPELVLDLAQVQPGAPQGTHRARIRSVNDGTYLYFLVNVEDATQNDSPNQLMFNGGDPSAESDWALNTNGQDAIGFMFAATNDVYGSSPSQTFASAGCDVACHQAQSLLNYESGSYPGNGMIDMWYWQAGTTNPQGYADDQYAFGRNGNIFRNERRPDVGADPAVPNFVKAGATTPVNVAGGNNHGWAFTRHLWDATSVQFNPVNPNPATGLLWAAGDIVPGWRLRAESSGISSRNNVEAGGVYSGSGWTVEIRRRLNTDNGDDARFVRNSDVPFAFAYFNNTRKYARFEYTALQQKPAPSHYGSNPRVIYLLIR